MSAKDEGSPSKRPYSFDDIRATCCSRPGGREQHGKRESAKTSSDEEGAADVLTHRPATGPAGPTVHGTCKPEGGGPPAHPPDAPGPRRTEPATTAARPGAPGQTPEPSRRRPGTASSRQRGTPRRKPAPRAGRANPPTRCAGHRPAHRVHPPHLPRIQVAGTSPPVGNPSPRTGRTTGRRTEAPPPGQRRGDTPCRRLRC